MITPSLTNWSEVLGTDIATQFEDGYESNDNPLALPKHFFSREHKGYKNTRTEKLIYIASNHPNSIVRTKACIILSRTSNALHSSHSSVSGWDIDVLRQLILKDWNNIIYNITARWCISILDCFAENGDDNERVVANSIIMMHNSRYRKMPGVDYTLGKYHPDDTFINSILRINLSLTDAVAAVAITTLNLHSAKTYMFSGFIDIALVWKMTIQMKLTSLQEVEDNIATYFPNMDATRNVQ